MCVENLRKPKYLLHQNLRGGWTCTKHLYETSCSTLLVAIFAEKLENELHFCFRELLLVENLEKQLKNTCFWLVFSNEFRSETLGFLACRWNTIKIASL